MTLQYHLAGQRFGRLLATGHAGRGKWSCLCDCGTRVTIPGFALRNGRTTSCGCHRSEVASTLMNVRMSNKRYQPEPIERRVAAIEQALRAIAKATGKF